MRARDAPSIVKGKNQSGESSAGGKSSGKGDKQGRKGKSVEEETSSDSESSVGTRSSVRQSDRREKLSKLPSIPEDSTAVFGRGLSPVNKRRKTAKINETPTQRDSQAAASQDEDGMEEGIYGAELGSQFSLFDKSDASDDSSVESGTGGVDDSVLDLLNQSTASSQMFSEANVDLQEPMLPEVNEEVNWVNPAPLKFEPEERGCVLPPEVEGIYKTLIVDPAKNKSTRKKSLENTFVSLLFNMVSCFCCDHVATRLERCKSIVLWGIVEEAFSHAIKTMPLKAYVQQELFSQLKGPEGIPSRTWPVCFKDYLTELYKPHTADGKLSVGLNWAKSEKALQGLATVATDEEKMKWFVGQKVFKAYTDAKGKITQWLANRWVPEHKLPSGYLKEHVFRGLRKTLRPMEAWKRATSNYKQSKYKLKKNAEEDGEEGEDAQSKSSTKKAGKKTSKSTENEAEEVEETPTKRSAKKAAKPPAEVIDLEEEDEELVRKAHISLAGLGDEWYPEYWLAFVLYSKPAGEMCLLTLNGGDAGIASLDPLATPSQAASGQPSSVAPSTKKSVLSPNATVSIAANKAHVGRALRDARNAQAAADLSSVSQNTSAEVVEHRITIASDERQVMKDKIDYMEGWIKRLKEQTDLDAEDQQRLVDLPKQRDALLQKFLFE